MLKRWIEYFNCNGAFSELPNSQADRDKRVWMAKHWMVPKSANNSMNPEIQK